MKAVNKFAVLFSLSALTALSAYAKSEEQAYLETCRKDPGVPVPVTVVAPSVPVQYAGTTVQLEFVVDVDGKPAAFSVKSSPDDRLATAVVEAVKRWRFLPAKSNDKPVATKVALPVKIVDPVASGDHYAAFE